MSNNNTDFIINELKTKLLDNNLADNLVDLSNELIEQLATMKRLNTELEVNNRNMKPKVQLLASNSIGDLEKLSKLLAMQLTMMKKLNTKERVGRSSTMRLLEKVVIKLSEGKITPQWRLLNTSIPNKYEYTISYFKRSDDVDAKMEEYPLYQISGNIQLIAISMVGSGVKPEDVSNLLSMIPSH